MWTKKSYDAIFDWANPAKRTTATKALLADGLDDIVARLETATSMGEWYKITNEAAEAVGPRIIEQSAAEAEKELNKAASALGRKGGSVKSERKTETSRKNGKKGGRPGMYTVTLTDENGDTDSWPNLTKREAIRLAKETAAFNPTCAVFIEWFRKSDGQHGYLNPSGDHDLTGHVW